MTHFKLGVPVQIWGCLTLRTQTITTQNENFLFFILNFIQTEAWEAGEQLGSLETGGVQRSLNMN